jgi:iron-sulfur cluster repair protein YtfE (RIC family)
VDRLLQSVTAELERHMMAEEGLLDGLQTLEEDLHRHIHEENNILFPRALELERAPTASRPAAG